MNQDVNLVNRRQMMMASVMALPLVSSLANESVFQDDPVESRLLKFRNLRKYKIRHAVTYNVGDIDLASLELWLPVPQTSITQKIENLKDNREAKYYFDKTGTAKIACVYKTENLPEANSDYLFEVTYEATTVAALLQKNEVELLGDRWYDDTEFDEAYLKAEKHVQTELPRIQELAQSFKDKHKTPFETANATYQWVLDHVKYKFIDGFGGAEYCLKNAHGECGDYVALFVAICRAAGIPSRPVVGFWADNKNDWHVWAEFLMPNGEWLPVDLSIGDQSLQKRRTYFGSLDNRRVGLNRIFEMAIEKPGDNNTSEFLQVGNWWYTASRIEGKPSVTYVAEGKRIE